MVYRSQKRCAGAVVEFALIGSLVMLLLIGLVVGAMGIFRYQQVAALAREGARYASVRGDKYQKTTGNPSATAQDVYNNVIHPQSAALNLSQLSYNVTWDPDKRQGGKVRVRVTYQWVPEAFLGGITLSSTSAIPISY